MNAEQGLEVARKALQEISGHGFGWDGDCGVCRIADDALAATEAIAPPVAAGSMDTEKFEDLLHNYRRFRRNEDFQAALDYFIAWGTQQHEAGYHEGVEQLRHERDSLLVLVIEAQGRAEKAEADLKQVNEWRNAALQENMRLSDVWMDRVTRSEARVKEMEADAMRWRYLRDLDHDLTGTAGQPCVALPNGINSGYYLTGPEAIYAVDISMAEAAQK